MAARVTTLRTIDPMCKTCKGKCYVPGDNKKTQELAHAMFGEKIPNACVNGSPDCPGSIKCPSALGLI